MYDKILNPFSKAGKKKGRPEKGSPPYLQHENCDLI